MNEFLESAKRETGDTNIVSLLTAALIVAAGALFVATSFSLI
jgi:hypothetical protein